MTLSVVIPTHQRLNQLSRLLSSLAIQNCAQEFEVIVVFNLEDQLSHVPDKENWDRLLIKSFSSEAIGVNRARNIGLGQASCDVVCFFDDDCYLPSTSFLNKVVSTHQLNPEVSAIGGPYWDDEFSTAEDRAYNALTNSWISPNFIGDSPGARLIGGNVSYKRKDLLKHNLCFDQKLVYGGTEWEFHQRLVGKGLVTAFYADLGVYHNDSISSRDLIRKAYYQGRARRHLDDLQGSQKCWGQYGWEPVHMARTSIGGRDLEPVQKALDLYNKAFQWAGETHLDVDSFCESMSQSFLSESRTDA